MDISALVFFGLFLTGLILCGCGFACWSRMASLFDTLSLDEAFVRLQRRLGAPRDLMAAENSTTDAPPAV